MDGATLQSKIYAGRAKAALVIGLSYTVWRPATAANPFTVQVATIKAAFNAGNNTYSKPNEYGDPLWFGDFDGRLTQEGDYLVRVSDGNTLFIAGQQQLLPIICIDCNRTLKITRQNSQANIGINGYGGRNPSLDSIILGNVEKWPCSILLGGRAMATGTNLPSGVSDAGFKILLPPSVPITINAGDTATDDLGRRYVIEGAERTDLGYRLTANEAHS